MGLSKAVSTSTVREKAAALLQRSNLLHYFPVLVCGDEVPVAKPDPAIFVEAAKRSKVEPGRCLVFEDSSPLNQAEHVAGMIPILVADTVFTTTETIARAYLVYRHGPTLSNCFGLPAILTRCSRIREIRKNHTQPASTQDDLINAQKILIVS